MPGAKATKWPAILSVCLSLICNSGCGATHCNRRSGFRITIFDKRSRGDNSKPRLERVVVAGEDGEGNAERRCGMICEHRMYGAAISQG